MEQKKILWIVAAVSVFILVIFGFALVINSPSRTVEQGRQYASAYTPGSATSIGRENLTAGENSAGVDPDGWLKNPGSTPGLDTEIVPAGGTAGLTDLNGTQPADGQAVTDAAPQSSVPGAIDVRNLTGKSETAASQASQSGAASAASVAAAPRSVPAAAQSETKSGTARASAPASERKVSQSAKNPVTVTEYWIQTGSFTNKLNAENARKLLTDRYLNAEIFTRNVDGGQSYRVRVGPYSDKKEAEYWLGTIAETPEFSGSYVSQVKVTR